MRLLNCFIPFFAQMRAFAQNPSCDALSIAAQLDTAITGARRAAADAGYLDAEVDEALFAVVAWADEVLLTMSWSGATQWQRQLLQRRYFNVNNAGVAFFERLDKLGSQSVEVHEVYSFCLSLGFGGRYAYDRNQKALTDIQRRSLGLVLRGEDNVLGDSTAELLFPDGYDALIQSTTETTGQGWRRWLGLQGMGRAHAFAAIVAPIGLLAILFAFYHVVIVLSVGAILPRITV